MNYTKMRLAGGSQRWMLPVACFLLALTSCRSHDAGMPLPELHPEGSILHLSISTPRSVALRGAEAVDPMQQIKTLHFAFYAEDSQLVTEVREVKVTSPDQLKDLTLALPEGVYKLVVIANATPALVRETAVGRPLSAISEYRSMLVDALSTASDGSLTIAQLNEQGGYLRPGFSLCFYDTAGAGDLGACLSSRLCLWRTSATYGRDTWKCPR